MKQKGFTILVAEDDPNDQQLLVIALQECGISEPVQLVNGGNEAIRYLKGEGIYANRTQFPYPAFLILDLKMPNGDGFAVLDHLRRNFEYAIVPTLILSSSTDQDDVLKAYMLGAHAYLKKPTQFTSLKYLMKAAYEFWTQCEVPEVDPSGRVVPAQTKGKLGERFT